jgi:hypothetical protein
MLQILLLLGFLIPAILFIFTQQRTLDVIQLENRLTSPGSAWMQLIPIFGFVWQFILVNRIAGSIQNEIVARQDDSILGVADETSLKIMNKRPTLAIGLSYCILTCIGIFLNMFLTAPVPARDGSHAEASAGELLALLCILSGIICWIIYWVQLSIWKRKILEIRI